jgi:hydrogenase maturation factor
VIVHVGFAISILDEEAAIESLNYFRQLDEVMDDGAGE